MLEHATVVHLDLHPGQTYAWYPDLNIVALARGLDEAGEQRALDDLQAEWRAGLRPAQPPPPPPCIDERTSSASAA